MNNSKFIVDLDRLEKERLNRGMSIEAFVRYLNIGYTGYYRVKLRGGQCTYKLRNRFEKRFPNISSILDNKNIKVGQKVGKEGAHQWFNK